VPGRTVSTFFGTWRLRGGSHWEYRGKMGWIAEFAGRCDLHGGMGAERSAVSRSWNTLTGG